MAKMDEFREAREAIKHAPLKKRLEYFWDYYKLPTICVLIAVICLISILSNILTRKEEVLNGIMLNRFWMQEEYIESEDFVNSYLEYRGFDPSDFEMSLNSNLTYSVSGEPSVLEVDINVPQVIAVQAAAGILDYMIADAATVLAFDNMECFVDLRDFFTREELEGYKENLIFSGRDKTIPIAIDVTDSECLSEIYAVQHEKLAIGLFVNAEHVDEFKCFLEYILAY